MLICFFIVGLLLPRHDGLAYTLSTNYLNTVELLCPERADAVLLIGATMGPARLLGSEAEDKIWLDPAAQVYAQRVGISLSSNGGGGGCASAVGSSGGAIMNSEQLDLAYKQINRLTFTPAT